MNFLLLYLTIEGFTNAFLHVSQVNLCCNYTYKDFPFRKGILTCEVTGYSQINNENTRVNIKNKYNQKIGGEVYPKVVKGFIAKSKKFSCFPSNLGRTFPHLLALVISESNLSAITLTALENFKELISLDLRSNEIEVLESNLFQNNQKLKYICLNNNKIQYVYPNTFNGLQELRFLDLTENICYSFNATTIEDFQAIQTKTLCSLVKGNNYAENEQSQLSEETVNRNENLSYRNSHASECLDNTSIHTLIQLAIVCALLMVIIILIQLILCCKQYRNNSEKIKDDSENFNKIAKYEYIVYSNESSTYEVIIEETIKANNEDIYSEVADVDSTELKIRDDSKDFELDDFYAVAYDEQEKFHTGERENSYS